MRRWLFFQRSSFYESSSSSGSSSSSSPSSSLSSPSSASSDSSLSSQSSLGTSSSSSSSLSSESSSSSLSSPSSSLSSSSTNSSESSQSSPSSSLSSSSTNSSESSQSSPSSSLSSSSTNSSDSSSSSLSSPSSSLSSPSSGSSESSSSSLSSPSSSSNSSSSSSKSSSSSSNSSSSSSSSLGNAKSLKTDAISMRAQGGVPANFQAATDWSRAGWTKFAAVPGSSAYAYIDLLTTDVSAYSDASWGAHGGNYWFVFWREAGSVILTNDITPPANFKPSDFSTTTWFNWLWTYTASTYTMKFYLNGTEIFTSTRNPTGYSMYRMFTTVNPPLKYHQVGGNYLGGILYSPFSGHNDEISMWSSVKSYSDLHINNKPRNLTGASGLEGWYRCGDAAGDVALTTIDDVVDSADLTIYNNAPFENDVP